MNLAATVKTLTTGARNCANMGKLVVKAHAPEILIGSGIVGFGITVFEACKATNKARDILEENDDRISMYITENEENDNYTVAMMNTDIQSAKNHTRLRLIGTYAPVATMGIASVILVLGGYRVLNGRYVGVAAAYKTLEAGFNRYRSNVVDEYGEETDQRMLYGMKKEDTEAAIKELEDNRSLALDNQKKKLIKMKPKTEFNDAHAMLFDCHSPKWQCYWTPDMALKYVKVKQGELQDKVYINGSLFGNEIADTFGLPRTAEGQVLGYVYSPGRFRFTTVDLGIDHMPEEEKRAILSTARNEDIRIWIRPNYMGVVYSMIGD